jgi:hypothetical protein
MNRRYRPLAATFLVAGLALAGCTQGEAGATGNQEAPATVERIQGSDARQVTLSAQAAQRIGLETGSVRVVSGTGKGAAAAPHTVLPLAALLYDSEGKTSVYTASGPLTFVRQPVEVSRIDGELAVLGSGPTPGTSVVTVGE